MDNTHASSRLLEACNTCRKRKVKCDRQRPICAPCGKSRIECSYTDRVKILKTPRRRPTRAKELEDRLERIEGLLKLPVAVLERMTQKSTMMTTSDHFNGSSFNGSDSFMIDYNISHGSIDRSTKSLENIAIASWAENGERALGLGVSYSDRPTQGNDSSTDTTDTENAVKMCSAKNGDLPRIYRTLPSKEEAIAVLELFFAKFNKVFPIHHQQSFMQLVQTRYSTEYDGDVGWWSNLNMVLAHGYRIRTWHSQTAMEDDEDSWGYLENALSVVPLLVMRTPSLSSIQALLGIAVFLQATPIPRSYSLLVANAVRLCHSIGLHRQESYHNELPVAEMEQRKRVFWICYIFDRDISMRSGQPPFQHDDDIDVDLPSSNLNDRVGYIFLAPGFQPINFLQLRIELASIQGAIYRDLYSAKASRQSDDFRACAVQKLDERLSKWKNSISMIFDPDFLIRRVPEPFDILHIVILHFIYFNCLILIHRCTFQNMSWKTRAPNSIEPFNPRNFSSKPIVIEAARNALILLSLAPGANYTCIWLTLQFSCSAIITLLQNIHLNPGLPNALPDFRLVDPMLGMFCKLALRHTVAYSRSEPEHGQKVEKSGIIIELMRMRDFCFALRDRAKAAIDFEALNTGKFNGPVEIPSSREVMQYHFSMFMPSLSNSNENPRAGTLQASEPISAKPAEEMKEDSMRPHLSITQMTSSNPESISAGPGVQSLPEQSYRQQNRHESHTSLQNSTENVTSQTAIDSQEHNLQGGSGLWNWWDLIEMDLQNNSKTV